MMRQEDLICPGTMKYVKTMTKTVAINFTWSLGYAVPTTQPS